MPKITNITVQQRRKDRLSVYLDGRYRLSLSQNQLLAAGLRVGEELSEKRIDSLQSDSEFGKALDRAYNFVSYRLRSRAEVVTYLRRREYDTEMIEALVSELESRDVINDARFASSWVEMRSSTNPRSLRHLSGELREKGIQPIIIEEVLGLFPPDTDVNTVIEIIESKGLARRYPDERKLIAYLAGKGFAYGTTKTALERLDEKN